jgi:hypothetical protein
MLSQTREWLTYLGEWLMLVPNTFGDLAAGKWMNFKIDDIPNNELTQKQLDSDHWVILL